MSWPRQHESRRTSSPSHTPCGVMVRKKPTLRPLAPCHLWQVRELVPETREWESRPCPSPLAGMASHTKADPVGGETAGELSLWV